MSTIKVTLQNIDSNFDIRFLFYKKNTPLYTYTGRVFVCTYISGGRTSATFMLNFVAKHRWVVIKLEGLKARIFSCVTETESNNDIDSDREENQRP